MTAWHSRGLSVPDTHATAAGHFPGHPVIPGALLLDEVARAIAGDSPLAFRSVKFLAPLRHGEALELHWHGQGDGAVRFEIRRTSQAQAVLAGVLEVTG